MQLWEVISDHGIGVEVLIGVLQSCILVRRLLDILNNSVIRNWLAMPGTVGVGEVIVGGSEVKLLLLLAIMLL